MSKELSGRRGLLAALGTVAGALAVGSRRAEAQSTGAAYRPVFHEQDSWMDKPGKHRVICDVSSAVGVVEALRFVGNIYEGNRAGYGVEQGDLAVIVILRHQATSFGYGNALWAKYNAAYLEHSLYKPASGANGQTTNPHLTANALEGFIKRGVQFGICATATRGIIRRITSAAPEGEAIFKEVSANLIPNSRLVPAGVVAVTRAQEYGYSVLHIG
jgi:intracellular sulfur oxidation DsrE/DsrF family protein